MGVPRAINELATILHPPRPRFTDSSQPLGTSSHRFKNRCYPSGAMSLMVNVALHTLRRKGRRATRHGALAPGRGRVMGDWGGQPVFAEAGVLHLVDKRGPRAAQGPILRRLFPAGASQAFRRPARRKKTASGTTTAKGPRPALLRADPLAESRPILDDEPTQPADPWPLTHVARH